MNGAEMVRGLRRGELMVWALDPSEVMASLRRAPCLSEADRREADRRPEALRQRFLLGRQFLRSVLGEAFDCDPLRVHIQIDGRGKPSILGSLGFSLSHADGALALAVCQDQAVGVDLERRRDAVPDRGVARRYFSETDLAVIQAAEALGDGDRAFLRAWTRLEARVKLSGRGLDGGSLAPGGMPEAVWVDELPLMGDLVGAVALRRAPSWIRVFQTFDHRERQDAPLAVGSSGGMA